jgi:hypothetical protein
MCFPHIPNNSPQSFGFANGRSIHSAHKVALAAMALLFS